MTAGSISTRLTLQDDEERGRAPYFARGGEEAAQQQHEKTRQQLWRRKKYFAAATTTIVLLLFYGGTTLQSMKQAMGASHPNSINTSHTMGENHQDTQIFDAKIFYDAAASAERAAASATAAAEAAEAAAAAATAAAEAANSVVVASVANGVETGSGQPAPDLGLRERLPNEGRESGASPIKGRRGI